VTLISFLIFSAGLKLTNNLDGSLLSFFGALITGLDCAKQVLFPSSNKTKLSQSLNFPTLFKFSSAFAKLKIIKNKIVYKFFFMKKRTNISQLRFKYKKNPLNIKNSDSNPFKQFNKWMKESIRNKIFEPTAMSLSTVNKRNKVSNRIVLLKGVKNNSFVFYTNLKSRKSYELNINKNVAAVFWWPQIGKQVRIEGYVKVVNKKEADYYFSTRTRESQIGAWASNQSSELKNRETLIKRFKIIEKRFENKDVPRPSFWSGYEIKPFLIEFWQGRENRLHDRIVYKKINQKKWKKYRLNP